MSVCIYCCCHSRVARLPINKNSSCIYDFQV